MASFTWASREERGSAANGGGGGGFTTLLAQRIERHPEGVGIQWDFAEEVLLRQADAIERCEGLFYHVILLVLFCFYFHHDTVVNGSSYDQYLAPHRPLTETASSPFKQARFFKDIVDTEQYVEYVMDVLLPFVTDLSAPLGASFPVGALRLRTQRARKNSCGRLNDAVFPANLEDADLVCYGALTSAKREDTGDSDEGYSQNQRWTYKSCAELGGSTLIGDLGSYHCGGFYFDVPLWKRRPGTTPGNSSSGGDENDVASSPSSSSFENTPLNKPMAGAAKAAAALVSGCGANSSSPCGPPPGLYPFWSATHERVTLQEAREDYMRPSLIDASAAFFDNAATRLALSELVLYNPSLQMFTTVKLIAEVSAGGAWRTSTQIGFAKVWTRDQKTSGVFAIVFFSILLAYFFFFLRRLFHRAVFGEGLVAFFSDVWNLLDAAMYALIIAHGSLRIAFIVRCHRAHIQIAALTYTPVLPTVIDELAQETLVAQFIGGVATVLLFFKLLKFLAVEKHVGMLLRVLHSSRNSLIGLNFCILFFITAWAIGAQQMFSDSVWDFHSVDTSFSTLYYLLLRQPDTLPKLLGVYDNRVYAGFYLWSFSFVAFLLLFTLVLAIFMDGLETIGKKAPATSLQTYMWRALVRFFKHPKHWPDSMMQRLRDQSEAVLLRKAVHRLRAYRREVKYPVLVYLSDNDHHVLRAADYEAAMRDDSRSARVDRFYVDLWRELQLEWKRAVFSPASTQFHEKTARMSTAVQDVISGHVMVLEGFSERLACLEGRLSELSLLLAREQANAAVLRARGKGDGNTPTPAPGSPRHSPSSAPETS